MGLYKIMLRIKNFTLNIINKANNLYMLPIILIFSLYNITKLGYINSINTQNNLIDYLISFFMDPFFLIYILTPILFIIIIKITSISLNPIYKIRHKNLIAIHIYNIKNYSYYFLILTGFAVILILITSLNRMDLNWSQFSYLNPLSESLINYGESPLFLIVLQICILYIFFAFWTLVTTNIIIAFKDKDVLIYIVLLIIYFIMVFSTKYFNEYFNVLSYLSLPYILDIFPLLIIKIFCMILISIAIAILWRN